MGLRLLPLPAMLASIMADATSVPKMHPEQAAFRSKATAFSSPISAFTRQAWEGMMASGVMVMQMSRSTSAG